MGSPSLSEDSARPSNQGQCSPFHCDWWLYDELLNPVVCLRAYIMKPEVFRGPHNEGLLFISSVGKCNLVKSFRALGYSVHLQEALSSWSSVWPITGRDRPSAKWKQQQKWVYLICSRFLAVCMRLFTRQYGGLHPVQWCWMQDPEWS